MPKAPSSVVGIDLGQHSLKAVLLQRKNNHSVAVSGFAIRPVGAESLLNAETLSHHVKLLLREVGSSGKAIVAAASSANALIRIIEQPTTPTHLLRDALRFNGLALLNQDCRDYVLDCDQIPAGAHPFGHGPATPGRSASRYLVCGLPRKEIVGVSEAFIRNRTPAARLQLAAVCNYNAFEFSHPDVFAREAFVLVDIGHRETRVLVGAKRELVLVRTIDYGGDNFLQAITGDGGVDRDSAMMLIEQNDPGMVESGRMSLSLLARELRSSIGFFEGQREEAVSRVYFSGGLVRALMPLQILSDELEIACDTWDPFQTCQIDLPKAKASAFDAERTHLNIACGAALDLLAIRSAAAVPAEIPEPAAAAA